MRLGEPTFQGLLADEMVAGSLASEVQVLLPARDQLGDDEIVDFQVPRRRPTSVVILDLEEARFPAFGQSGGRFVNTVGVVAEGLMERRQLPDRPVDEIGPVRFVFRVEVGIVGGEEGRRCIRELAQDGR